MSDSHRKHAGKKEYARRRPLDKEQRQPLPLKRGKQKRADEKRQWRKEV